MRRLLGTTLLLAACAAPPPRAERPRAPSSPFVVAYRPAASTFEILDNVSLWWPGKCDAEYRDAWLKRFGITPEDEQSFASYAELRRRYYPVADAASDSGLFAPRKPPDRVAEAFYGAERVEEALASLATVVTADDAASLARFFARFEPKTSALLAESRPYGSFAGAMQRLLDDPRAAAFAARVQHAFGVTDVPRFTVLYVWWPAADHSAANNRGSFLLLKYDPQAEGAARDADVPIHELVHYVSSRRTDEQKRALTKTFLAGCDVRGRAPPGAIFEEPLAVAFQKLYLRETDPLRVDEFGAWYGDPWVSLMAKTLTTPLGVHLERGGTIDETFARRSARLCAQIAAVADRAR